MELSEYLRRVLPSKSDDRDHCVYWIHDQTCEAPDRDGYVGVVIAERFHARHLEHKRSGRFPNGFEMQKIYEGNAEGAYLYEAVLRPYAMIGWNHAAGGALGRKLGIPKSLETKKKISMANKGRHRPDLIDLNRFLNQTRFKDLICPHCGKNGSGPTMMRYHFKNCKSQ